MSASHELKYIIPIAELLIVEHKESDNVKDTGYAPRTVH